MSKRKQKLQFRFVPIRRVTENSQKNSKKIQKIQKNTITASFEAKIGRKMMRNIENKNYRSVPFLPDALWKIPKKQQKY